MALTEPRVHLRSLSTCSPQALRDQQLPHFGAVSMGLGFKPKEFGFLKTILQPCMGVEIFHSL